MQLSEIPTPALVVEAGALERNLGTMTGVLPAARLRPHVKAHKCTGLARQQAAAGHLNFTCATIRECEGMAAAGLGTDLLLANEVLDARRIGDLIAGGSRVTVAVDSAETIGAAAAGGVREVLIDVNVGLPRCGCAPQDAGRLAGLARRSGLEVRGVMGYEGHVVGLQDAIEREERCQASMALLTAAHDDVGGELISAGGTGTYAINTWANEIQAGSYALMDTAYGRLGLPFEQAAFVLATVISRSPDWAVADAGLKAFGMDKGNPILVSRPGTGPGATAAEDAPGAAAGGHPAGPGTVMFCSDEHVSFRPAEPVGERVWLEPAHIDPTMACHERVYLVSGNEVVDIWPVDLRGW